VRFKVVIKVIIIIRKNGYSAVSYLGFSNGVVGGGGYFLRKGCSGDRSGEVTYHGIIWKHMYSSVPVITSKNTLSHPEEMFDPLSMTVRECGLLPNIQTKKRNYDPTLAQHSRRRLNTLILQVSSAEPDITSPPSSPADREAVQQHR